MMSHPVHFEVERSSPMSRVHVLVRLAILLALGSACWSSVYWIAYLGLPIVAALLVAAKGGEAYLSTDAPDIVAGLRWLAGAYAYLWLLTDVPPIGASSAPARLHVETTGAPSTASALSRIILSLPALLLLAILTVVAGLFWVIGAVAILATRELPAPLARFLALALRYRLRFLAYHVSLVQEYPATEDAPVAHEPRSHSV